MASSRQTVSFLQQRFAEVGLRPDSRRGQNFLVDLNLVDLIARSANLTPSDVVLEVGAGTGSLTSRLASQAAAVVTVEIDQHLLQLAREELASFSNVVMLSQDALQNKNRLHPLVIAAVQQELTKTPGRDLKLVANLPYNIATPVISNLLRCELAPASMTVTIQKELADRMEARPRTKDYNALSVWVQSQCRVKMVRVLPPSVFWPRPKVESAIIRITPSSALRDRITDREFFHQFVRSIFLHRRKFLRSNLLSAVKTMNVPMTKQEVDDVLNELSLDGQSRCEELDPTAMIQLCDAIQIRGSLSTR